MPKSQTERIIDVPYASRSGGGMVLSGGGGSSVDLSAYLRRDGTLSLTGNLDVATGVTIDGVDLDVHKNDPNAHHNAATAGDGIQLAGQQVAVDATVVRTSRQVISGGGLTGGGDLSADRTLAVGAGTLITVGADTVGVTPGANYQFVGTGDGTAAGWRNVSELAGSGLTATDGVLAVGVANSGAAGLTVEADAVRLTSSSNPGANARVLATTASGGLQLVTLASSAAFTSGFAGAGYRIDYGITEAGKASAEFDNLTVRGRMRVYELLIQQIRATNGSVFVASASRAEQVTADSKWSVNGTQLTFNGSDAEFAGLLYRIQTRADVDNDNRDLYHGFLTGDIVRSQRFAMNSGGNFATVRQSNLRVSTVHSLWEYTAHWRGGDVPVVGDDFVRLGSDLDTNRQGALYLTADDSNAPYMDIVDGITAHADWNTASKIKVRLGKLTGITDADFGGTLSGYGLYANNVYLKGQIVVTGGNALTTGGAAADINANTTTIDGGKITANSITATQIAAGTITANKISVDNLSAIKAKTGALEVDGSITLGNPTTNQGVISTYNKTGPTVGTGFYIGWLDNAWQFGIGSSTRYLAWNGSTLQINADNLVVSGSGDPLNVITASRSGTPRILQVGSDGWTFDDHLNGKNKNLLNWSNIGSAATPVSVLYATDLGSSSKPVSLLYANQVGTTGGRVTNGYFSAANVTTLTAGSGTVTGALSAGSLTVDGQAITNNAVSSWTSITLGTGFSAGAVTLAYAKAGNIVLLKGSIKRGANFNTVIGTLPAGARPAANVEAPITAANVPAWIRVETDGDIVLWGVAGGNDYDPIVINVVLTTL